MSTHYALLTYLCLHMCGGANPNVPPPPAMPEVLPVATLVVSDVLSHWKTTSLDDVVRREVRFRIVQQDHDTDVERRGEATLLILDRNQQRIELGLSDRIDLVPNTKDDWLYEPLPRQGVLLRDRRVIEYWRDTREFAQHELPHDEVLPIGRPLFDIHPEIPQTFLPDEPLIKRWDSWSLVAAEFKTPLLVTTLSEGTHELLDLFDWKRMVDAKTGAGHFCLTGKPKAGSQLKHSLHHVDIAVDVKTFKPRAFRFTECDTSLQTVYSINQRVKLSDEITTLRFNQAGWRERFPW